MFCRDLSHFVVMSRVFSARARSEGQSARFVTEIVVVRLRIQARQILDAAKLHHIFARDDVTCAHPRE
jgi:hypothetical protein